MESSADRRDPEIKTDDYEGPDRRERARGSVGRRQSDRHERSGGRLGDRIWLLVVSVILLLAINAQRNSESRHTREQRDTTQHIAGVAEQTRDLAEQTHKLVLRTAKNQQANTKSLCTFRADLARRVNDTTEFLKHPERFPGFSSPQIIAAIKVSVTSQRATLASLSPPRSPLHCSTRPKIPKAPPPNLPPNISRALH